MDAVFSSLRSSSHQFGGDYSKDYRKVVTTKGRNDELVLVGVGGKITRWISEYMQSC